MGSWKGEIMDLTLLNLHIIIILKKKVKKGLPWTW